MSDDSPRPSNRRFGLTLCLAFALIGAWVWWRGAQHAHWIWGGVAALLGGLAILAPGLLTPLNRAWMALGSLLGRVFSPIVLGVLYFLVFAPVSLIMRLAKRDALRLRSPRGSATHWIERQPGAINAEAFREQG
jgi:hypothetical protein